MGASCTHCVGNQGGAANPHFSILVAGQIGRLKPQEGLHESTIVTPEAESEPEAGSEPEVEAEPESEPEAESEAGRVEQSKR